MRTQFEGNVFIVSEELPWVCHVQIVARTVGRRQGVENSAGRTQVHPISHRNPDLGTRLRSDHDEMTVCVDVDSLARRSSAPSLFTWISRPRVEQFSRYSSRRPLLCALPDCSRVSPARDDARHHGREQSAAVQVGSGPLDDQRGSCGHRCLTGGQVDVESHSDERPVTNPLDEDPCQFARLLSDYHVVGPLECRSHPDLARRSNDRHPREEGQPAGHRRRGTGRHGQRQREEQSAACGCAPPTVEATATAGLFLRGHQQPGLVAGANSAGRP